MSQFDFEEVKVVRGSEAAVPDLLSRPMGTAGSAEGMLGYGGRLFRTDRLTSQSSPCFGTVADQEDGLFAKTVDGGFSQHSLYAAQSSW